ncbi:acetylornithine deacetylase [Telmatospirillum sp.]|uniref:acetylornithine deacetylase n=1 Tax=Telmatospirillum sp. TaxID=2079197 RepID=UPI00284F5E13|nr:acetylornithine deacetylase [Telmatospirillum sp.]MDR3435481.1 acetylornithine deacetylase [Telmatospirillum sp.]
MRPSPACISMIERLVAFDTTSHRSNLDAISFLRETLEALGAQCRLTYDDERRKANLYATLGPTDRPGIMLSGHTDVVPVDGQTWSSDPFRLTERNSCFFGRGSADMKSFIGLCMALAPEFLARGLETPLHFSFSYDEEMGCVGVRRLISDMAGLPIKPKLCIVGEPTGMQVIAGHKGKKSLRCHVHGKECHSALAQGVNAVEAAAEVIAHISTIQRRIRRDGPFDQSYEPPYTTLHTGIVKGGRALNIVPRDCEFEFEIRALPGHDSDALFEEIRRFATSQIEPEMKAVDPATGLEFEIMNNTTGFDLPDDHPAVRFVSALTGANQTGRVSFGTEAGLFNDAGVPTVVCGPGFIEQAHRPDEFISADQLAQGEAFLRRLMDYVCR